MEIEDEFDVENVTENKPSKDEILHLFDYRRTRGMEGMPPQEKTVVYRHLCREVNVFMRESRAVDDVDLQNLLAYSKVWRVLLGGTPGTKPPGYAMDVNRANIMIEEGGLLLYEQGVESEFFTFILDGKAEVFSGRQKFRSEVSRFTILCPEVLTRTQQDYLKGLEFSSFVPDFTCRVITNSRILRISKATFHKCLQGKLKNYSCPPKEMREKIREIIQRPKYNPQFAPRVSYQSVRELRRDYYSNLSVTTNEVGERPRNYSDPVYHYSEPHTLSSILGESAAQRDTNSPRLEARVGSVTSLSLSGAPNISLSSTLHTTARPRQRYYDASYLGHFSEEKGQKTLKAIRSTTNIINESTVYNSVQSITSLSQISTDKSSNYMEPLAAGEEIVTQPGQKPGDMYDSLVLISAL